MSKKPMEEPEWTDLMRRYLASLREQYDSHPDLFGVVFQPKPGGPADNQLTAMSFSLTLLERAGGLWRLLREWEPLDIRGSVR